MGLSISLQTRVPGANLGAIVATLEAHARREAPDARSSRVGDAWVVSATLHPAADPIELRITPAGELTFAAKTSTVGPGYHAWLCDWLDEAALALGMSWAAVDGDPKPWFFNRDRAQLESEFLDWLRGIAAVVLERVATGMTGLCVSLPAGDVQFLAPGFALTPVGPREEAWWRQAAAEPSACTDLFPWWSSGHGVHELEGRALSLMWSEVVWRAPLTERERRVHEQVLSLLAMGYAREPRFDWPWREWLELLLLAGGTATTPSLVPRVRERALAATGPLAGYLRHDVRVPLKGGWTVRVPGSFARALEPDGVTLRLGDHSRTVFVMTGGVDPDLERAPLPKGTGERLVRAEKKLDSAALVTPQGDGWQLVSNTLVPGELAVVTVHFPEHEREWALSTWRSIAHPGWRR